MPTRKHAVRDPFMNTTVAEIAQLIRGAVVGDGSVRITGVSGIKEAANGDLSFLASARYGRYLKTTKASALLVPDGVSDWDRPLIQVQDPYAAFVTVVGTLRPYSRKRPIGIHDSAVIGANARLGKDVALGAHVYLADDVEIGDGTILYPGVYVGQAVAIGAGTLIYPNAVVCDGVRIGARCILHSGAVIGSDGFGFSMTNGVRKKIPQTGTVVIGDDVEIGANSTVDRATFGRTVIGAGTKIDNQVQIGHNVQIGEHCIISGMCGIAGSAHIGDRVTMAGQVGVAGHIEIGENAVIAARAGVTKSVAPGQVVSGFPAMEHAAERRIAASTRKLPDALRRIRALEKRIEELEGAVHGNKTEDNR